MFINKISIVISVLMYPAPGVESLAAGLQSQVSAGCKNLLPINYHLRFWKTALALLPGWPAV